MAALEDDSLQLDSVQLEEPLLESPGTSRLLDRRGPQGQSRGRWQVRHDSRLSNQTTAKRWWDSWFYALAYRRTFVIIAVLWSVYVSLVFGFAIVYFAISRWNCDMDINNHMEALYFSLSTMTTIGYGVSDYYFGGCWVPFGAVLCQVGTAILFDAVAIGLLFSKLSRGHKRAKTIVFSRSAVIQDDYFMFRLGECRRYLLVNVSVKVYCVRHERRFQNGRLQTVHYVTFPLHLQQENHILLGLPQVLVHKIDGKSPLKPPEQWYTRDGALKEGSDLAQFWQDVQVEVVAVVEGTDELTGAVLQTRHSYTVHDVEFNATFGDCSRQEGRHVRIDWEAFHQTHPSDWNPYKLH